MKQIILLILLSFVFDGIAAEGKRGGNYLVAFDTLDKSLDLNTTKITGTVKYDGRPVTNGYVSTIDKTQKTNLDENGNFEMIINSDESGIFFFSVRHGEIVVRDYKISKSTSC